LCVEAKIKYTVVYFVSLLLTVTCRKAIQILANTQNFNKLALQILPYALNFQTVSYKGVAKGGQMPPPPIEIVVLGFWAEILAEMCLKCIILVTHFQKSPSAGGSPLPVTLNLQYW